MGERKRVGKESDLIIQHYGWMGLGMQVGQSDQVGWVKVKNTVVRARSTIWVGEIQVEHRQFSKRIREVMVGNAAGRVRSEVRVGVQDNGTR